MTLMEAFKEGGWGMYPVMVFGLVLLAVAVRYALDPSRRHVPLLLSLGALTLSSGVLGFVTGVIKSLGATAAADLHDPMIPLFGAGEALNDVAFALVFVVIASIAAAVGAFRLSSRGGDQGQPAIEGA